MTAEQTKQYEICKTRRHEEEPVSSFQEYHNMMQAQQASRGPWKTCRWCGTEYQEVPEIRQVERQP